jgi:hypothetical protein
MRSLECLLVDFDGFCTISGLGIIANGAQIDHLMVCDTWDGDCAIKFYCGDDPTDEDGYSEEIVLTDEQINGVLDQFLDLI